MSRVSDYLVWIDCEMTGLDLRIDALIEVALLITDAELNVVGDGVDLVIKPPQEALDTMPDVVRAMHTASGLLDELPTGITLAEAEQQLLTAVRALSFLRSARHRCAGTRSRPTAASLPVTCPSSTITCTTA